jgi:hypothetical protein
LTDIAASALTSPRLRERSNELKLAGHGTVAGDI